MPEFITQRWEGSPGAYGGRRSRASFTYKAYIPDSVARLDLPLSGPQSLIVSDAEGEIRALNAGDKTGGLEAIGALLLRAESVASSKIEGLELSQRSLARALFDPAAARGTARLVAGNVRAMQAAISIGDQERLLHVDDIVSIHRTLLRD
jgi:Fic family protein